MPSMIANDIVGVQPMFDVVHAEMKTGETYVDEASMYGEANGALVEWYWVKPGFRFANMHYEIALQEDRKQWCIHTFGDAGQNWEFNAGKFCFANEADRTMFVLKWK